MDMQAAPPIYSEMDTGQPPSGNPPILGQQVPGMTGGLPSSGGLSITGNPLPEEFQSQYADGGAVHEAENVRQMGRGEDSVLMHVTPHELQGLQALAMAHGGSLTINPHTGLPEAGFLGNVFKKLLPTLVGAGLMFIPGVNAIAAAGIVGGGSTLLTGSLKKGLMAGLSAYGGASLARGLGAGVQAAKAATTAATSGVSGVSAVAPAAPASLAGATPIATSTAAGLGATVPANIAGGVVANAAPSAMNIASAAAPSLAASVAPAAPAAFAGATPIATSTAGAAKTGLAGLAQNFGNAAKAGLPKGTPAFLAKNAPMLAGMGLMQGVSGAMAPTGSAAGPEGQIDNSYQGPYYAQDRKQIKDPEGAPSSKQRRHFAVSMPEIYNTMGQVVQPGSQTARGTQIMQAVLNPKAKKGQPMYSFVPVEYQGGIAPEEEGTGYAHGGEIELSDGAFVLDARTVSEIGNGSSNAGMEALRRIGGFPVQGPGDGVSDSVPARIGRDQPARVARDEVIMPANAVRRIGRGNPQRGADKLYALMDKAHAARKKAGRGQDTKLSRGLA